MIFPMHNGHAMPCLLEAPSSSPGCRAGWVPTPRPTFSKKFSRHLSTAPEMWENMEKPPNHLGSWFLMAGGLPVYPKSSKSEHFGTEIQDQPLTQIPSGCPGSFCTTLTELSLAPRPMTKRRKFATAKVSLSAKPRKLHANPTVCFFLGTIEGPDWYLTPFNVWENELLLILIHRLRKGRVLMNQPTSRKRTKDISMKELGSCPCGCLPSRNLLDARKVTNSQIS